MTDFNRRDVIKRLGALLPVGLLAANEAASHAAPAFPDPPKQNKPKPPPPGKAVPPAPAPPAPAIPAGFLNEQRCQEIIASLKPAVVLLEVETDEGMQWGSGFFVSSDGVLITNRHVVQGQQKITCLLNNKEKRPASLLKVDSQYDLAVVKIETDKPLPTVKLGDSAAVHEGLMLAVTGYPEPRQVVYLGMAFDSSTSRGSLNGLRYGGDANTFFGDRVLQIDAPVTHGNSGGPVYRLDTGEVIGVLTAALQGANNLTFAMPINAANQLVAGLGIKITPNVLQHDAPEAQTEAGDLRILNTVSKSRELPPLFGIARSFTTRFNTDLTQEAVRDWRFMTGGQPANVAPLAQDNGLLYFGATDGNLYRMDTANLYETEQPPVIFDVSDEGMIFLHEPYVDKDTLVATAGSLNMSHDSRLRTDVGSIVGGLFGLARGSQEYINVKGSGKIIIVNRHNDSVTNEIPTNFAGTPCAYQGKLYYGGIGERGCLSTLGDRQKFDGKERHTEEGQGFDYIQKDGDKPFWNHVGYAGPLGLYTVVVPMLGKHGANGRLIVVGRNKSYVQRHDLQTGAVKWKKEIADIKNLSEPMSTAMFVDEKQKIVYALALQTIVALDAETGDVKWKLDQGQELKKAGRKADKKNASSVRFSPGMVIENGIVYIGSSDRRLHAIRGSDGTELWVYETHGAVGQPSYHEGQIFFGSTDKYIHVVDAQSGDLVWKARVNSAIRSRIMIYSGMVYAPTEEGSIYTIRIPQA